MGTLGVAGCITAAEEVRRLARAAGKRTYTLLMGKPSPAKLANFPEVDVFVMVADAQVHTFACPPRLCMYHKDCMTGPGVTAMIVAI